MNNYEKMLSDARLRFTGYDMVTLCARGGVEDGGEDIRTSFLRETVLIHKATGKMYIGGREADFGETLSVFDWLCDGKVHAVAAEEYCTVGTLPGVYVGGSGLSMEMPRLAKRIDAAPDAFRSACQIMGATEEKLGDLGAKIEIFPGLHMCLKFYFADEEFPPQLTFLWDKNMLQFVRYETVYYIAGCLQKRLLVLINE
jgi:hypothetical protein